MSATQQATAWVSSSAASYEKHCRYNEIGLTRGVNKRGVHRRHQLGITLGNARYALREVVALGEVEALRKAMVPRKRVVGDIVGGRADAWIEQLEHLDVCLRDGLVGVRCVYARLGPVAATAPAPIQLIKTW